MGERRLSFDAVGFVAGFSTCFVPSSVVGFLSGCVSASMTGFVAVFATSDAFELGSRQE